VWGYMAENGKISLLGYQFYFFRGFMVLGFRGKKKVQKKRGFLGPKMGYPARRGVLTFPNQREMLFFRVYRGFFLLANRLRVVSRAKKIFFRGKPPNF
jgi:hypothetical protein